MDEAEIQAQARMFEQAFRQAQNVEYPDYEAKEDFPTWLNGYREKIRNAFGLNHEQDEQVNAEVVRSISGKLQCGTPLNAYNRLTPAQKDNYADLVKALTDEFLDPQEKRRFIDDTSYNKRNKGESLKDFAQRIREDQNRYGDMLDTVREGENDVPNKAKIKDGIRRFKRGIRTKEGKKDADQRRHLNYNLVEEEDLTWEHALEVASRWEAANDVSDESEADASGSEGEEEIMAVTNTKSKKVKKKQKKEEGIKTTAISATDLATLFEKIEVNARGIDEIKKEQNRLSASFATWRDETNSTLSNILTSINALQNEFDFACDEPSK